MKRKLLFSVINLQSKHKLDRPNYYY